MKREPLLNDEAMFAMQDNVVNDVPCCEECRIAQAKDEVRDFYEAKINSGELMVVKTAKNEHKRASVKLRTFYCGNCHTHTDRVFRYSPKGKPKTVKFCPGCGAKIIE